MSEITKLHDKHRRDTAVALVDAHLDHFDTLYVLLDQGVSFVTRDATPLGTTIPGRQRRSVEDLVSRVRASMDRLEAAFTESVRHLQAAE